MYDFIQYGLAITGIIGMIMLVLLYGYLAIKYRKKIGRFFLNIVVWVWVILILFVGATITFFEWGFERKDEQKHKAKTD